MLFRFIVFISFVSVFFSCSGNSIVSNKKREKISKVPIDTSRILISKQPEIDSNLTNFALSIGGYSNSFLVNRKFSSSYAAKVNASFSSFTNTKINPIKKWVKTNKMIPEQYNSKTLFYPFAGADFVYANSFFNDVDNYIMVGLEGPGSLPDYTKMTNQQLDVYFHQIFASLNASMRSGFFLTKDMAVQFKQKEINGTIHSLLFYLARTNHRVISIKHFALDSLSKPVYSAFKGVNTPGIHIQVFDEKNRVKNIYYYKTDLSNFNPNLTKLTSWVNSFGSHHLMLKAASYLNFSESFSKIRNYLLTSSNLIVQDDSGIPYRFLASSDWDLKLYGGYKRVINLFANKIQPALVLAYKDSTKLISPKLPFNIGYNVAVGETNLQVAYKKSKK